MSQMVDFFRRVLPRAKDEDASGYVQPPPSEPSDLGTSISLGLAEFDPDHSISAGYREDRLGFRSVANTLASSLLTQATRHGLVVSIEGVWGSGKSSLVDLLEGELKRSQELTPEIVRFEPWVVGDRDGMLVELMSDLGSAVDAIGARESVRDQSFKKEAGALAKNLRGYGAKLSRQVAPLARLAGLLGIPGGESAGRILTATSEILESFDLGLPLSQLKRDLTKGLRDLNRRIVVIMDDLDRLEPSESAEITRLIRAVADFPNIIYVLCYDPKILAKNLSEAVAVEDGVAFLEKIVQVRFKVPQPEAFDLRRWLLEECTEFYEHVSNRELSDDERRRLHSVCDVEGQLLKTPRDVVRTLNAVRLHWPPIAAKTDYADLVWLQMVKLRSEALYEWIEHYLVEYAAFSDGCIIHDDCKKDMASELRGYMPNNSALGARSLWTLKRFVPGIKPGENVEDMDLLFNQENPAEVAERENKRRLASTHHTRYYFALSRSSGALDDMELNSFISSAKDGEDVGCICMNLIMEKRSQGGTKFDLLIDRLNRLDDARLPVESVPSILMALANCADTAGLKGGRGLWGRRWSWDSAEALFKKLMARLDDDDRSGIIRQVFGSGEAIGWLMSELLRGEMYVRGRYAEQAILEEKKCLSDEELREASSLLVERFRSTDRDRLVNTPELLSLMYGWKEADDEAAVREWVQEQTGTDAGLLALLSACRTWMQTNNRTSYPLNRRDLKNFLDFDEALDRLRRIAGDADHSDVERTTAKELLDAAELGEDH